MDTTANRLTAFSPTHPGEIIKEEIIYRGISQRDLSKRMGVSYSQLNELLNGKRPITAEFALLIEAALGLDPEMLLNLQIRHDMQIARNDKEKQSRWKQVREMCASLF